MLYPKIREMRILHDYKQDYVADRLGMSQPEYSRLENGHRHARIEDLRMLSSIYEVSISSMMLKENDIQYGSRGNTRRSSQQASQALQISSILHQQEELITHILQKQQQTEEYLHEILKTMGRDMRTMGKK